MELASLCLIVILALNSRVADGSLKSPHIVFILADDLGWNDVGYHGSDIKTPTIDRLAASGIKLERHYVQAICSPSRGVLMSGRYQVYTGIQTVFQEADVGGLPTELTTLPEVLKEGRYINYHVGKWNLGYSSTQYTPTARGFHFFNGLYTSARNHFTHERCMKRGDGVCGIDYHTDTAENLKPDLSVPGTFSANLQTGHAVDVINRHDQNNPMFLYLAYSVPHFPLQAPQKYKDMNNHIEEERRRTFAGMVTAMDEGINEMYEALVATGMWNNTILIFTSDNGGSYADGGGGKNNPLRGEKASMFEGGIRVPTFVVSPHLPGGVENNDLFHLSDWFPTLSHLAGVDTFHLDLDGHNIWKTISANEENPRKEILVNINPTAPLVGKNLYPDLYDVRVSSAIISGKWKLITGDPYGDNSVWMEEIGKDYAFIEEVQRGQNIFLFDIANDPNEEKEISDDNQDIVIKLLTKLAKYNDTARPSLEVERNCESANPERHGGALMPWEDVNDKKDEL